MVSFGLFKSFLDDSSISITVAVTRPLQLEMLIFFAHTIYHPKIIHPSLYMSQTPELMLIECKCNCVWSNSRSADATEWKL